MPGPLVGPADPLLERHAAQLLDCVARVHALGAALVAVHAAGAVPDTVVAGVELGPLLAGAIALVPGEAVAPGQGRGAHELRVGGERVALGVAGGAQDALALLVDLVHRLLGHDPLALGRRPVGDEVRLHGAELVPEGRQVDHEVLHRGELAERVDPDRPAAAALLELLDLLHARQHGAPVGHARARAADRAPARVADGQGAVLLVLQAQDRVQQRQLVLVLERELLVVGVRRGVRLVAEDVERAGGHQ